MKNQLMNGLRKMTQRLPAISLLAALLAVANPAAAQAPATTELGQTLSRIAEDGTIYLGFREAATPFSYVIPGDGGEKHDAIAGYSWDICRKIAEATQARLGRPVKVNAVTMTANARIMMVKIGMADIDCGSTTNTVARQKLVTFSDTIYIAETKVMVRKDSGIRSLGDLGGKRVVVTLGTTADRLVKQLAATRALNLTYLIGRSHGESMALMNSGKADAYVGDDAIIAAQRAGSPLKDEFVFLDDSLSTEPYGLMLPKEDPQFKKFVDGVLVGLMQSGELARIYDKWFMNPIPPKGINLQMPMTEKLQAVIANPNDTPVN